ncbi:MAG: transcriptional repressor LexA [Ignavibacteria bacterium]|nr:transcriptional repressor LexA [Ignavibacteria bacterium]
MHNNLTDRQKEILEFIENTIYEKGYAPTYREIGQHFGIASTFGVKRHLDALVKKGYVLYEENSSRTLTLTKNKETSNSEQLTIQIPVVGRVAAGYPIFSEENIEDSLTIDKNLIKYNSKCFALKVKGDSMINAGILENDIVIIFQQPTANSGEIVVALLNEESTLKRFIKEGNSAYLKPENISYPLIPVTGREDFSIVGKVIGLIRKYN